MKATYATHLRQTWTRSFARTLAGVLTSIGLSKAMLGVLPLLLAAMLATPIVCVLYTLRLVTAAVPNISRSVIESETISMVWQTSTWMFSSTTAGVISAMELVTEVLLHVQAWIGMVQAAVCGALQVLAIAVQLSGPEWTWRAWGLVRQTATASVMVEIMTTLHGGLMFPRHWRPMGTLLRMLQSMFRCKFSVVSEDRGLQPGLGRQSGHALRQSGVARAEGTSSMYQNNAGARTGQSSSRPKGSQKASRLEPLWCILAKLSHVQDTSSVAAVAQELNLPATKHKATDMVVNALMGKNRYTFSMDTAYDLMESMNMPARGHSAQVCLSMLPDWLQKDRRGGVQELVHALLQLKLAGYLYHMVHGNSPSPVKGLSQHRRRKGNESTVDSSDLSVEEDRVRAMKSSCASASTVWDWAARKRPVIKHLLESMLVQHADNLELCSMGTAGLRLTSRTVHGLLDIDTGASCLKSGSYLSDDTIWAVLFHVAEAKGYGSGQRGPRLWGHRAVWIGDTFLFDRLFERHSGGFSMIENPQWFKGCKLSDVGHILLPIHLPLHWITVHVDVRKHHIHVLDSLGTAHVGVAETVKWWLQWMERQEQLDPQSWTFSHSDFKRQSNGYDCGVFMLADIISLAEGRSELLTQTGTSRFRAWLFQNLWLQGRMQATVDGVKLHPSVECLEQMPTAVASWHWSEDAMSFSSVTGSHSPSAPEEQVFNDSDIEMFQGERVLDQSFGSSGSGFPGGLSTTIQGSAGMNDSLSSPWTGDLLNSDSPFQAGLSPTVRETEIQFSPMVEGTPSAREVSSTSRRRQLLFGDPGLSNHGGSTRISSPSVDELDLSQLPTQVQRRSSLDGSRMSGASMDELDLSQLPTQVQRRSSLDGSRMSGASLNELDLSQPCIQHPRRLSVDAVSLSFSSLLGGAEEPQQDLQATGAVSQDPPRDSMAVQQGCRQSRKPEPSVCVLARSCGHYVPPGMTIMELGTRVLGVRWDSAGEHASKQEIASVYAKNRRRVIKAVEAEVTHKARDGEIQEAARRALELEAMRLNFPASLVASLSLEDLQGIIRSSRGVGSDPPELTPADLHWLGQQPLGSAMSVPGREHRPVSASQRAEVLEARKIRSRKIFKEFLDIQDEIQWQLCSNCMERKLVREPYQQRRLTHQKVCKRCAHSKAAQVWSAENKVHFREVPSQLQSLTEVEAMLIARVAPVFRVQVLKGGQLKSCGNTIAFVQNLTPLLTCLPRLPKELHYMFVRRTGHNKSNQKIFRVRRQAVLDALVWLKEHNEFYKDIVIDRQKVDQLPVDGSVEEEMVSANFIPLDETVGQEAPVSDDVGPAPSQQGHLHEQSSCGEIEIEEGAVLFGDGPGAGSDFIREGVRNSLDVGGVEACLQRRYELRRDLEWRSREQWVEGRAAADMASVDGEGGTGPGQHASAGSEHVAPCAVNHEAMQSGSERTHATGESGVREVPGSGVPARAAGSTRAHPIPWGMEVEHRVDEKCMGYWSMAFPTLIPDGVGDFNVSRTHSLKNLGDWAEHCMWWHDGRFSRHPYWRFIVMNIIQRQQAMKQATFFVGARMGQAAPSVGELKERISNNDPSVLRSCIAYAGNVSGTDPYWYLRKKELQAMVKFQAWKKSGLPSFFLTGSCAEFHWTPLIKLLQQFLHDIGDHTDIVNDLVARRRVVKQYSNVVCAFFHFKTEAFIDQVLKKVYGVSEHYIRFEYAASRGQIHFHMLAWRDDRLPHGLLQKHAIVQEGELKRDGWEEVLGLWFEEMGFTAEHPCGADQDWWVFPEGKRWPEPRVLEEDFRLKMDDTVHRAHVCNKCMMHTCSGYCLRKRGDHWICRGGFGDKDSMQEGNTQEGQKVLYGKKPLRETFGLTQDPRGYLIGEMKRTHPRIVQHIQMFPGLWGGNCDQTVVVSPSDPDDPDPRELYRSVSYCCGYMCKNSDTVGGTLELYKSVVRAQDEEEDDKSCLRVCRQCINKSVGKQEISAPCADSFLARLPLVRSSVSFVSVSLGTDRRIQISKQEEEAPQLGDDERPSQHSAIVSNVRDRYISMVEQQAGTQVEMMQTNPLTGQRQRCAVEHISLYEYASGPGAKKPLPIGSVCPVPSGGNVEVSWPLCASYCKAMILLHEPGCTIRPEADISDSEWVARFCRFLDSEHCPSIIAAEVHRAEQEHYHRLAGPENVQSDEEGGSEGEEEDDLGSLPEWAGVMRGEDACGDEESGDTDLFMGDSTTDWQKLSFNCGGHPGMMCQAFADKLADKETEKVVRQPETVTHEHFQSLTRGQQAAVQMVLSKMLELRQCSGAFQRVKPLRLIVAGTAGTGKTRIIKIINAAAHQLLGPQSIRNVAPSGTAAYLMGGRTLHSLFPIPIGPGQYKPMKAPRADRLMRLQKDLEGAMCLCVDERSMIGTVVFGWMEFMLRMGMNMGQTEHLEYGGLPILVMFGDDGQLPPVNSQRLFSSKAQTSSAGQMGQQLYSRIQDCIFLTQVVRQMGQACTTCSSRWHSPGAMCNRLGEFLWKLRYQRSRVGGECETIGPSDVEWLRERQEHHLRMGGEECADGGSSICIQPKLENVMAENRLQLEAMAAKSIPVVKCLAKDCGPCVKAKMKQGKGEYEFGQLPKKTFMCKGAPVMLTTNLCTEWGLFNGAMGTVVDIYYAAGRMPSIDGGELPDVVFVDMPSYCGEEVVSGHPTLVPIGPRVFQECCRHECTRVQIPLRLSWAITVHKSQGMTIGSQQHIKAARIHLGDSNTEKWAAGAAFVQLSRVSEIGALCIQGPVDLDRFIFWSAGKQAVAAEDERLYQMHVRTLRERPWVGNQAAFMFMVQEYFTGQG
jgi:hypothetical protein